MESWKEENNQLVKDFSFKNFREALAFANKVGGLAESRQHHPDIFIHSYKKVRLILSTHAEGRITEKDHSLAMEIDNL